MLVIERSIGESLAFNNSVKVKVKKIANQSVTFAVNRPDGYRETCTAYLHQPVIFAGFIKGRIYDVTENLVTLIIESPKNMLVKRL